MTTLGGGNAHPPGEKKCPPPLGGPLFFLSSLRFPGRFPLGWGLRVSVLGVPFRLGFGLLPSLVQDVKRVFRLCPLTFSPRHGVLGGWLGGGGGLGGLTLGVVRLPLGPPNVLVLSLFINAQAAANGAAAEGVQAHSAPLLPSGLKGSGGKHARCRTRRFWSSKSLGRARNPPLGPS